MTSILDGPGTAGGTAEQLADPVVNAACPVDAAGGGGGAQAHAVVRFTESLTAALDRLEPVPAWSMTPAEQRRVLVVLERQQARLAELKLRVLVAADRNEVGADSGATSTAAWLAHQTKTTRQACFRDVHLAQALDGEFEATRRALAAGTIDAEKARVIVAAVRELTEAYDDLPVGTHAKAEAHLLELAAEFDAAMLRKLGKRLFEVVCPQAADAAEGKKLAEEEAKARRTTYLSLRDNGDGTTEGRFRLPSLHAGLLKKAVQALTAPRRLGQGRLDPSTGKKLPAATLAGQGLIELIENHLNLDTLPTAGGSPFTVVVTIPLEQLCTGLGVAVTDVGVRISAGEVRRLACAAGLIPMVLGGRSVPLDLGRAGSGWARPRGGGGWPRERKSAVADHAAAAASAPRRRPSDRGQSTHPAARPPPTTTWPTTPNPGPCTTSPTEESASTDARDQPGRRSYGYGRPLTVRCGRAPGCGCAA